MSREASRSPVLGRWRFLWENLRSSLWFVPTAITVAAVALAALLIEVDTNVEMARVLGQFSVISPEGARGVLTAIASSVITVAGVAFSITVVTLVLTASQYSSRVLRQFMRDRANQVVLGILVGTFGYCLVVLQMVHGGSDATFVPTLAVLVGLLLAFVGIGSFMYFLHHIASSIQASHIASNVARETLKAVDRLFPDQLAEGDPLHRAPAATSGPWQVLAAASSGYLQRVDDGRVLDVARRTKRVVRLHHAIGDFITEDTPLVSLSGPGRIHEAVAKALRQSIIINTTRTIEQDAAYGIRQLVDVALKALSPGVNDTTTAINCIDWLGAVLLRLTGRNFPSSDRWEGNQLRVIVPLPEYDRLLRDAFDQVRQSATSNAAVLLRQLEVLAMLLRESSNGERRRVLLHQASLVIAAARRGVAPEDREEIEARARHLVPEDGTWVRAAARVP